MSTSLADDSVKAEVPAENISLEVEDISTKYMEELGLSQLDIKDIKVQSVNSKSTNVSAKRNDVSAVEQEVGALVVESYDDELGLNEVTGIVLFDEEGEPMSVSELVSDIVSTPVRAATYASIQGKYLFAFEDMFAVYANPYQVTVTITQRGVEYIGGDLMFHGTEVNAKTLETISGGGHAMPYKSVQASTGLDIGKSFSSAASYYYKDKLVRLSDCALHGSSGSMYLEYRVNGKMQNFSFDIVN